MKLMQMTAPLNYADKPKQLWTTFFFMLLLFDTHAITIVCDKK